MQFINKSRRQGEYIDNEYREIRLKPGQMVITSSWAFIFHCHLDYLLINLEKIKKTVNICSKTLNFGPRYDVTSNHSGLWYNILFFAEHWASLCKTGSRQSPIALTRSAAVLKEFHPFSLHGYGQSGMALLKNNGHSGININYNYFRETTNSLLMQPKFDYKTLKPQKCTEVAYQELTNLIICTFTGSRNTPWLITGW